MGEYFAPLAIMCEAPFALLQKVGTLSVLKREKQQAAAHRIPKDYLREDFMKRLEVLGQLDTEGPTDGAAGPVGLLMQ